MTTSGGYEIAAFLEREGAVGVLIQIHPQDGMLFGELEDSVHVSQTTLSNRLDEAADLDLLERTIAPGDHGNAKRYRLTRRGRKLRTQMKSLELDTWYQEFFAAQQNIEERKTELCEWVADSEITNKHWPPDPDFPHTESD